MPSDNFYAVIAAFSRNGRPPVSIRRYDAGMKFIGLVLVALLLGADAKKPEAAPATRPAGRKDGGVEEFEKLWKDKQGVVLDVRTVKEYQAGHIPGALNIDVNAGDF